MCCRSCGVRSVHPPCLRMALMANTSPRPPERVFRAICTNGDFRIRTRATVGLKTETIGLRSLPSRASAVFPSVVGFIGNWIAAVLPFGSALARALSNNPNPFARLGPFLQLHRWICKICRLCPDAGPSFICSLVQHCQESTSGVSRFLSLSPVPFVAAAHDVNSSNGAEKCPTKEFPKTEKRFPRIA